MPDMTVHLADATQVARIVAKIFAADKLSRTITRPLPDGANEAIALLQEAAADIEALGVVPPPDGKPAEPEARYDPASTTALITERAANWDHDRRSPETGFGFTPPARRM